MQRNYRSLFWPILLIGVGIIWLLTNLGVIQPSNLVSVLRLWPLLLIVVGLDLLIGRKSPLVGGLIGLAAVAAVVVILLFGPSLGIRAPAGTRTETFTDPIGQAASANITLDLAERHTRISDLTDTTNLIDATLTHTGTIDFSTTGTSQREIRLRQVQEPGDCALMDLAPGDWEIGLSPNLPLSLTIDGGSGSGEFDFSKLNLTGLSMDMGSGSSIISLPAVTSPYQADIASGSGSIKINLAAGSPVSLRLDSGSCSVNIRLPADAAVRVEVQDDGSGSLNLAGGLDQISGDRETGVWQTSGYETAAVKIQIVLADRGSGSITIR